jgi:4-hydroxy-tetrahydrodipicolinate synthase
MKNFLHGTGVAIVTPFTKKGNVDVKALERLVKHLIDGKVEYLVVMGTTGESVTLTKEEKQLVIDTVVKTNKKRLPLVLGIGGNNTAEVVYALKHTNLKDFVAILSVAPYYNKPNQQGYYEHYKAVAKASKLPVILYNVPGRTGSNVSGEWQCKFGGVVLFVVAAMVASGSIEQIMYVIKF